VLAGGGAGAAHSPTEEQSAARSPAEEQGAARSPAVEQGRHARRECSWGGGLVEEQGLAVDAALGQGSLGPSYVRVACPLSAEMERPIFVALSVG
jgi:hypothetical protein